MSQQVRLSQAMIREAFAGAFPPVRQQPGYRAGLLLVAVATALLPALYVAMIALVGYGVVWHVTENSVILVKGAGFGFWRLIAYLGPVIGGLITILFMFKPLFAQPVQDQSDTELDSEDHPLLFAFIEEVRRRVRAPAPKRVVVNCDVNASASLRRGVWSLFGHDLTLTIGLPLLTGLSLRQLAGVLAHEFGHFSQGSGMRLTYLIRSVNLWFVRVVYERDRWDVALEQYSTSGDARIGLVLVLTRILVWVTRRILWLLMLLGYAIANFMLRAMELDADRYETRVSGSDTFERTAKRLRILGAASQWALSALSNAWSEKKLCDDFPGLVATLAERMPQDVRQQVENMQTRPSLFDTHPPDATRIESARKECSQGIFRLEGPASWLVEDLPTLCRRITLEFYRGNQGLPLEQACMLDLEVFLRHTEALESDQRTIQHYFHGLFGLLQPLQLPGKFPVPPDPEDTSFAELARTRQRVVDLLAQLDASRTEGAETAKPLPEGPSNATSPTAEQLALEENLRQAQRERLLMTLALLGNAKVRSLMTEADRLADELNRCFSVLNALDDLKNHLQTLVTSHNEAGEALQRWSSHPGDEGVAREATRALGDLQWKMHRMETELANVAYPFEHAHGKMTIAHFATSDLPPYGDPGPETLMRSDGLLNRLSDLYDRCLARLGGAAEQIERIVDEHSVGRHRPHLD